MADQALPSQRYLFNIPDDVTYLNCANMSPQLRSVSAAGEVSVRGKEHPWDTRPQDWFTGVERLRALAGQVFGTSPENIVLVPSVSYGMAVAAANVRVEKGQKIVFPDKEFPSNYHAWNLKARREGAEFQIVQRGEDGDWTRAILNAIDNRTAVVSVPNCHWTDGGLFDLVQIGEAARHVGAALVIDASQSLGAHPLPIDIVQPDFLMAVGYKWLLGPYALGYLYVSPKWHAGTPLEDSWINRAGSEDFSGLVDYEEKYRPGARRYDMGESSNFVLVPMAQAALQQVLAWGIGTIRQRTSALTTRIDDEAETLGISVVPRQYRIDHLIGLRFPQGVPATLPAALAASRIAVSIRGDAIRVAPHVYNTEDDIEVLFRAIRSVLG